MDIVESISRILNKPPKKDTSFDNKYPKSSSSWAPYKVFNIGNSNPTRLMDYIQAIEQHLNKEAIKDYLPMQPGDVPSTHANCSLLEDWIKFKPETSIYEGVGEFIRWYKKFYDIKN